MNDISRGSSRATARHSPTQPKCLRANGPQRREVVGGRRTRSSARRSRSVRNQRAARWHFPQVNGSPPGAICLSSYRSTTTANHLTGFCEDCHEPHHVVHLVRLLRRLAGALPRTVPGVAGPGARVPRAAGAPARRQAAAARQRVGRGGQRRVEAGHRRGPWRCCCGARAEWRDYMVTGVVDGRSGSW